MSLINKIRIAIILVILLTATGSLIFSTIDSKKYLEEELQKKNSDNANVLALSMSQMEKDPVTIDLFISAQFDAGHYRYVGLFDPENKVITERVNTNSKTIAPHWFTRIMPVIARPAIANIQSGWTQFGTIHVESDVNFTYDRLWSAVKNMALWTLLISLISYFVCGYLLSKILSPLKDVIAQAKAIGERRFITIQEPETKEFKFLVQEMNLLSGRIKNTLGLESERLDELRLKHNYDEVTELMNHDYFINSLEASLQHESFGEGAIIVVRLCNLAELDQRIGYVKTNTLLKSIGAIVNDQTSDDKAIIAGRVNGRDLAIFSSQAVDEFSIANQLKSALMQLDTDASDNIQPQFLIVLTKVRKIDDSQHLFKALDFILEISSLNTEQNLRIINANSIAASKTNYLAEWKLQLNHALTSKHIKLEHFPVIAANNSLIHYESPVRLQLEDHGKWLSAGEFIDWAIQLDLMKTLDTLVLETAIALLSQHNMPICLNVSESAMRNKKYIETAVMRIKQSLKNPELLALEVPEIAVFNNLNDFRDFCSKFKDLGCKIGIEHVNLRIARIGELYDLGLDYIKFDASLIRGVNNNDTNKTLLRGLCLITHSIGISAIAEGVNSAEELATLKEIGMDGMTGPFIKYDNEQPTVN
jgi:EAL domain-containing protein (putative c-di-GMP-specific phosphodiesterase class I)/GGDEF domain-containing protein